MATTPRHSKPRHYRIASRTVRLYVYGVAIAAVPVLVYAGVMDPTAAPIVLPLVLALLNLTPADVEAKDGELG